MGAVISFFRPAASTRGNWSSQELAEFYRVEAALIRSGMRITSEQGLSDEDDPWFVFCGIDGDAFIHFARIDGNYVVASDALDHPMRGSDFRTLLNDIAARHPDLLPLHGTDAGTKLVIHPAALLAAIVAAAALALAQDDAFAHDAGGDAAGHDSGSPTSHGGGTALEPPPASVKDHSEGRHQGDNRRQAEAVLFTAMAFAAQAAAADELDHRSAADPLQGGQAGAGTAHLTQSEVVLSAGSSAGSSGAQAAPAQTLSPLGATSGASTQAGSTSVGSERLSTPAQPDKPEFVGEGPGPMRAATADSAPTGGGDSPSASVAGAIDTTVTARSSSNPTADGASDPSRSADTARGAKQAVTSSNTDDGTIGRASHPAAIQAQHQGDGAKAKVIPNLRSNDDGSPNRSDNGKGEEGGNQDNHGSTRAESAAGEPQGEDVAKKGSGPSHGNGSDSGNGQESGPPGTAPGQLKKAEKPALASENFDTIGANTKDGQGSGGSKIPPGKAKHEDTHDVAPKASGASSATDGSGPGPGGPGKIQGKVKHEDKLATASDASALASDGGDPQGSSVAAGAPGKEKHKDKIATAPDGADVVVTPDDGVERGPESPESAPSKEKKAATSPDAHGPAGKDKAAEHGNSEGAPGHAKHDAQALEASDAADGEASAPVNSSGHGSNKGATLPPAGSDRASPQVESADTSGTAAPASPAAGDAASGHRKLQAQSIDNTDMTAPTRPSPSQAESGSLDAQSKPGMRVNPSSSLDKIKSEPASAKVDSGGNLVFSSDHQDRSEAHRPPSSPQPDAEAHGDVGLVGIAHHHGALHHPDYH